jgi:hypothetical protein
MKIRPIIFIVTMGLFFTGLVAPANAYTSKSNAAGIKCVNKDLVAGVCLPKNRKKWSKSIENNALLGCLGSAMEEWAPDFKTAGAYCGCVVVSLEKSYSQSAYLKSEQLWLATGQMPQKWINAVADCAQYQQ